MTDTPVPTVVLLAEDEALVRMFAADLLRDEAGFRVIEAVNADEALTVLEATSDVRALVTDVEMPGSLDGFTLARLVHKAWPHIGIVVVSARVGPDPGDMPPGARFVAKPYSTAALVDAVHLVVGAGSEPILLPDAVSEPKDRPIARETLPGVEPARPMLPVGIPLDPMQAAIGAVGGLAQPLSEPDE